MRLAATAVGLALLVGCRDSQPTVVQPTFKITGGNIEEEIFGKVYGMARSGTARLWNSSDSSVVNINVDYPDLANDWGWFNEDWPPCGQVTEYHAVPADTGIAEGHCVPTGRYTLRLETQRGDAVSPIDYLSTDVIANGRYIRHDADGLGGSGGTQVFDVIVDIDTVRAVRDSTTPVISIDTAYSNTDNTWNAIAADSVVAPANWWLRFSAEATPSTWTDATRRLVRWWWYGVPDSATTGFFNIDLGGGGSSNPVVRARKFPRGSRRVVAEVAQPPDLLAGLSVYDTASVRVVTESALVATESVSSLSPLVGDTVTFSFVNTSGWDSIVVSFGDGDSVARATSNPVTHVYTTSGAKVGNYRAIARYGTSWRYVVIDSFTVNVQPSCDEQWEPAGPVDIYVGDGTTTFIGGGSCAGYGLVITPATGIAGFSPGTNCTVTTAITSGAAGTFKVRGCQAGTATVEIRRGSTLVQSIILNVDYP